MKNSTFQLYISSLCSKKNKIGQAVRELAQLGFKHIELTGGTVLYDDMESDLSRLKKEYGLSYLVHNYFPPPEEAFVINIASRKADIQEKTLALVEKALTLARKFEKNLYTMHPGFINDVLPELKDKFFVQEVNAINSKNDFFKNLEKLCLKVVPPDFKLGVENLSLKTKEDKFSFICDDTDIENFLEHFKNNKRIGMLLDLGHLNVSSRILGFDRDKALDRVIDRYADKLFAFHLSENNGYQDLHGVLLPDSWQVKFLAKRKNIFQGLPIVLEWHDGASQEIYESYKAIEEVLN